MILVTDCLMKVRTTMTKAKEKLRVTLLHDDVGKSIIRKTKLKSLNDHKQRKRRRDTKYTEACTSLSQLRDRHLLSWSVGLDKSRNKDRVLALKFQRKKIHRTFHILQV